MIIVTGRGHSGTTFLMGLFKSIGMSVPDDIDGGNDKQRHGLEGEFKRLCRDLFDEKTSVPTYKQLIEPSISPEHKQRINDIDSDVVKSPHAMRVMHKWMSVRDDIDYVVIGHRDVDVVAGKLIDRGWWEFGGDYEPDNPEFSFSLQYLTAKGITEWACDHYDIPRVRVHYPTSAINPDYCYNQLKTIIPVGRSEFRGIHGELSDDGYIRNPERGRL